MAMLIWCDGCGRMTVDPRATAKDIGKGKPGPWDGPCDRCGGRDASWCEVPQEQLEADLREACRQVGIETAPEAPKVEAEDPQVTRSGLVSMQVCVPSGWTDTQVEDFSNARSLDTGWKIRREGSKYLAGAHERVPCSDRAGYVHIMLDL